MTGNGAEIFLITVVVVWLVICLVTAPWAYRLWVTRSLYLKDFERFSSQAEDLRNKTLEIMEDVAHDNTASESIKLTNQKLLETASEWDDGLQTALAAWGDFIEMQRQGNSGHLLDTGKQQKRDTDHLAEQRKKHARFMIRFMRAKVLEGLSEREELSVQLQRIHVVAKTQ
jgi:hypothetical protein